MCCCCLLSLSVAYLLKRVGDEDDFEVNGDLFDMFDVFDDIFDIFIELEGVFDKHNTVCSVNSVNSTCIAVGRDFILARWWENELLLLCLHLICYYFQLLCKYDDLMKLAILFKHVIRKMRKRTREGDFCSISLGLGPLPHLLFFR